MSFADFSTIIGTLGFPIAACCYMFYSNTQMQKQHKAETDNLAKAIENNTNAITELSTLIKDRK